MADSKDKHPASVPALLDSLRRLKEEEPKAVKSTVHLYPASLYAANDDSTDDEGSTSTRRITSWKMTEHMYFNANNKFPTLARGLFTEELDGEERIVARGYDKFFNTDETAWTGWEGMKHHTRAPYHLTLKSNGCLILISALSPKHLVVASKHSLGTTTEAQLASVGTDVSDDLLAKGVQQLDVKDDKGKGKAKAADVQDEHTEARQHAEVGRMWLKRTLDKSGKREDELAQRLWDQGLTAVLELCDDSFEEHVIATPAHWTGLHLHGLNTNTPHFNTLPPEEVSAFAADFGFIPTKYITLQTIDEVRSFTSDVAQSGSWEGDMIEGFVVRCTLAETDTAHAGSRPPYRPGSPFFFKVKFEEPYLLYRTWREVTRAMLPLLQHQTAEEEQKIRKRVRGKTKRPEVEVYVSWVDQMLTKEPRLFDNYDRGVVKVRDRFLRWIEAEGKEIWDSALAGKPVNGSAQIKADRNKAALRQTRVGLKKKYVIVPMAIPGCGKTLVGLALSHLFGFGHTQSDDVTTKKTAPTFLKNVASLLEKHDVVYADRNNHIDKHYNELTNMPFDTKLGTGKTLKMYDVRFIAVQWDVDDLPFHQVLRICSERVVKRGDNHQTLRPDPTVEAEHEAIVSQFLRNFTPPDPQDYERVIHVGVMDDSISALRKVVNGLSDELGLSNPGEAVLEEALASAAEYRTTTPYHAPAKISKAIRYFGLAPEIDLESLVSSILASHPDESVETFLKDLKGSSRITAKPHVTLSHEKNVQAEKDAADASSSEHPASPGPHQRCWDQCQALASESTSAMYHYNITHLVWDDRVMTLIIDALRPKNNQTIQLEIPQDYAKHLHITVGTRTEEISAFESRGIVAVAREGIAAGREAGEAGEAVEGGGKVRWFALDGISGEGRVRGMW